MPKWGHEARIGLMIFISIVVLGVGIMFLGDYPLFHREYTLIVMLDNVRGLYKGDPVTLLGVEIGKVGEIGFKNNRVSVTIRVDHKVRLPAGSSAKLQSTSVMGGKCIEIRPGGSNEYLGNGDSIVGEYQPELAELAASAQTVVHQLRLVLWQLSSVIDRISPEEINQSFASMKEAGQQLKKTVQTSSRQLDSALKSFEILSENLNKLASSPKADSSLAALAQGSKDLTEITTRFQSSLGKLDAILNRIEKGEGTLGKLAKDDSLYQNIQSVTGDLQELIRDFQKNPQRYIHLELF